mgnify:CR=1 FL=1
MQENSGKILISRFRHFWAPPGPHTTTESVFQAKNSRFLGFTACKDPQKTAEKCPNRKIRIFPKISKISAFI